uniref:Uncharacterized protein n=1 Tax=viral metagenome TaxID=1070528 RepID=A0A6C0HK35_9ZZZZ
MTLNILHDKLPAELVRLICSYDSTYHGIIKTDEFKKALFLSTLSRKCYKPVWTNSIVSTILFYAENDGFEWGNEWGGVFEHVGGYHTQYWQFFDPTRFRLIYECGNSYMKFKIVPNVPEVSDDDYLMCSESYDGIICDDILHHQLVNLDKKQRQRYFDLTSKWDDKGGSKLALKDVEYLEEIHQERSSPYYIWFCMPP